MLFQVHQHSCLNKLLECCLLKRRLTIVLHQTACILTSDRIALNRWTMVALSFCSCSFQAIFFSGLLLFLFFFMFLNRQSLSQGLLFPWNVLNSFFFLFYFLFLFMKKKKILRLGEWLSMRWAFFC